MKLLNKARRKIKQYFLRRRVKRDPTEETARMINKALVSLYYSTKRRGSGDPYRITLSRQAIVNALWLTKTTDYHEPFRRVMSIACKLINDEFIYTIDGEPHEFHVRRMYSEITLRSNAVDFYLTEQFAAALDEIKEKPFVF